MQLFEELPLEDSDETERSLTTASPPQGLQGARLRHHFCRRALRLGAFQSHTSVDDFPDPGTAQRKRSQPYTNRSATVKCSVLDDDGEYVSAIDRREQIAWMWAILFAMFVPEALVFMKSVQMSMFQTVRIPRASTFFLVFVLESLHVVGLGFLVFVALPQLDALRATMICSNVAVVPALLRALSQRDTSPPKMILNISAFIAQCTGPVLWSVGADGSPTIGVALLLSSFAWWQCFADENSPVFRVARLSPLKRDLDQCSMFVSLVLAPWRMMLAFVTMLALAGRSFDGASEVIGRFHEAFQTHDFPLLRSRTDVVNGSEVLELVRTNYVIWTPR
ncbi:hypothetical protein HPB51_023250 [Rhipicephalus microplus]|uniref:Chitin synthase chs-1/2 N-terminal putative transporter domain-containing protein n=1 Tax=Rhipicephalus microplus TaxID=6941 RepID=A0A9J6F897_RHIMP|nr:hypothetical protein HPB51_023250 [Rhipicephalus microplus]